jgi:transposase
MSTYTVAVPEAKELGVRVTCDEHGTTEEFRPEQRTVAFFCDRCGYEIEVDVRAVDDWRDYGEMC